MYRGATLCSLIAFVFLAYAADYQLYTCTSVMKEYVVGAKLLPSGLFVRTGNAEWKHLGYNHPFLFAVDYDPRRPGTLYVAAGNGLIRVEGGGSKWTILTGSDVTELRDVAVDRSRPGTIYFAHSAGIRATHDGGTTWTDASGNLRRKFTEAIRVDATQPGVLLAGTEQGIFRSENGGKTWQLSGAAGFQVLRIEQSPHDRCYWLATTEMGGLFASHDCGRSFENVGHAGAGTDLYDVAFDPVNETRIALAGWGTGVQISEDRGKTWRQRNAGLPRPDVWSIAFDPQAPGRIYASVHEEALYRSDDSGEHWTKDGQDGGIANRIRFIPTNGSTR